MITEQRILECGDLSPLWPMGKAATSRRTPNRSGRLRVNWFCRALLTLLFAAISVHAGACADPAPEIMAGYRSMYDLDFTAAHRIFADWKRAHPEDPLGPMSDAAAWVFSEFARLHILESEFFTNDGLFAASQRLTPDPAAKTAFDAEIAAARKLGPPALTHNPNDESAALALIFSAGLESDYLALIEKRYLKSLDEMKASRLQAEQLLQTHPGCADAYLAIGVENYILSLKPMPLRWILRLGGAQTDSATGVAKLQITADKGRLLQPLARLMLGVAALRAHDPRKAEALLAGLSSEFPHNRLYTLELAKIRENLAMGKHQ